MIYLKAKIFASEGSSLQEANNNLKEEEESQIEKDEKEIWHKKMGLQQEIDMNVAIDTHIL